LEFGSTNPKIGECRAIDFDIEFKSAAAKSGKASTVDSIVFNVNEYREALITNKCSEKFVDPEQHKVHISAMRLDVLENSLTIPGSSFSFYTSDDVLTEEVVSPNTEEDLVESGTIFPLGKTKTIPPRFIGELPIDLNPDPQKFDDAEVSLVALVGSILAVPKPLAQNVVVITKGGEQYYMVPKGKLSARMIIDIKVTTSLIDAWCILEEYKKAVKEDDEKRKDNYYKNR
jgi:hypothetical protein